MIVDLHFGDEWLSLLLFQAVITLFVSLSPFSRFQILLLIVWSVHYPLWVQLEWSIVFAAVSISSCCCCLNCFLFYSFFCFRFQYHPMPRSFFFEDFKAPLYQSARMSMNVNLLIDWGTTEKVICWCLGFTTVQLHYEPLVCENFLCASPSGVIQLQAIGLRLWLWPRNYKYQKQTSLTDRQMTTQILWSVWITISSEWTTLTW